MNLAINARDAMQGEGRIDFATARVADGAIEIAVGDTGCGMRPELIERVFEPFFTTKATGKGSGLGLSMVYGFVRQSGGSIAIESAPGKARLCASGCRSRRARTTSGDDGARGGGAGARRPEPGRTVLVVDDDPDLLTVTADRFSALGYRVLTATDGATAWRSLERTPEVRLLYTDVVMPPPWDGPALAREALTRRPGLAVLLTSAEPWDLIGSVRRGAAQTGPPGACSRAPCHGALAASDLLHVRIEDVAGPALGTQEPGRMGIGFDLAAQPQDQHVDGAIEHVRIERPGALQQLLAAQHPAGGSDEGLEQQELRVGQGHRPADGVGQQTGGQIQQPARESPAVVPQGSEPGPAPAAGPRSAAARP